LFLSTLRKAVLPTVLFLVACDPTIVDEGERVVGEIVAGEWRSSDTDSAFVLSPESSFPGIVRFRCNARLKQIGFTVLPDRAENIRAISSEIPSTWAVNIYTNGKNFSETLIAGNGQLPRVLIDPDTPWLQQISRDGERFELTINQATPANQLQPSTFLLPSSKLIAATVEACF